MWNCASKKSEDDAFTDDSAGPHGTKKMRRQSSLRQAADSIEASALAHAFDDGKLDAEDFAQMKAETDAALAEAAANAKQGAKKFFQFGTNLADKADVLGLAAKAKQAAKDLGLEEISFPDVLGIDSSSDDDGGWDETEEEEVFQEEVMSRANAVMLRKVETEQAKQKEVVDRMCKRLEVISLYAAEISVNLIQQADDIVDITTNNVDNTEQLVEAEECVRHSVENTGGKAAGGSSDDSDDDAPAAKAEESDD